MQVYNAAMPGGGAEKDGNPGVSRAHDVDVAALFAQLSEEVRRVGPRSATGSGASSVRLNTRSAAERLYRVSADRPIGGRTGAYGTALKPIKVGLRKLMRWYVEPVFADQRAFNDALLKLLDDLSEEVERLRAEVAELRARPHAP